MVGSYTLLAFAMFQHNAAYTPYGLACVCLSFLGVCIAGFWARKYPTRIAAGSDRLLTAAFIFFLVLSLFHPPGIYIGNNNYVLFVHLTTVLLALLAPIAFLTKRTTMTRSFFILAIVLAVTYRILMPIASPKPVIDVFADIQESVAHMLNGLDPYSTPVRDVYGSLTPVLQGYVYPPADLYLHTIAYVLFKDARYIYVFAELFVAWTIWSLTKGQSMRRRQLLTLIFLFHPRALFVLEQAWLDPLILLMFSVFLLLRQNGRERWSAAVYGYMLSLKQYLIFFVLHWFLLERRWTQLGIMIGTAILTAIPFLLISPHGLWENGILYNLQGSASADSLNFAPLLMQYGIELSSTVSLISGIAAGLLTFVIFRRLPPLRGYLFATTITTFAIFLFGARAYCNYYYLVSGLMVFLLALHATEETKITA